MSLDRDALARIILAGINDIEEWRLGDPGLAAAKGYPREFEAELIDDWGIVFIDVTIDAATDEVVCHEVNGANAVGSDALTGDSSQRARNEAQQAVRRARELGYLQADGAFSRQVVTLHGHQHWPFFRTGGEFYPRVANFADCLAEMLPGVSVECHAAADALGPEMISVVMGDIPSVSARLTFEHADQRFFFAGRPVVFLGNPNFLPELARTGKFDLAQRNAGNPALRVLHGWKLADLIHDKARQQELFANTGVRPLACFSAGSVEEAVAKTRAMLARGPVVIKPSNTSGGAGVEVVTANMTDEEITRRFETMLAECRSKYGDDVGEVVFPLCGFEFVRSTGYRMEDGAHLWDLRIAVQFEPGRACAYPVSLRLTPEPFDQQTFAGNRRQWISNVSGRRETLLKSGMDDEVLAEVGFTDEIMDKALRACALWTQKAWDAVSRDGGKSGAVYEDACEEPGEPFYHAERFTL
jgi:hypothetical protein